MKVRTSSFAVAALVFAALGAKARADDYAIDPVHSGAVFRVSHVGLTWVNGRFNDVSGNFSVDAQNPAATRFELSAQADSVDTNNAKRNEHLKSPDFFNAAQFPTISFRSTTARPIQGGYEVGGELTLHGVTKPVTIVLTGGRTAEFPRGVQRTGYTGEFTIKRSEFGMDKMIGPVGDEIFVQLSFEGTKK
jgi:polyisoprenoid-binding protein YceI